MYLTGCTANSALYFIKCNSLPLLVAAALDDEITMTEDMIEDMMIVTITADHIGEAIFVILDYFLNCAFSSMFLPSEVCQYIFRLILIMVSSYKIFTKEATWCKID